MRLLAIIAIAIALCGCAHDWDKTWNKDALSAPPGGTGLMADNTVASGPEAVSSVSQLPSRNAAGALPPFAAKGESAAYEFAQGYRVGAGDKLSIRVAGEADLTGEYVVDASGIMSMPYVQSITVAGLNTSQIENIITTKLKNGFLRDPKVSVQAISLRPFYIMGEVTTAGSFAYQPGMTVQNAIAIAGGYGPRADQGKVLITRKNATGTSTQKVPVTTQVYPGDIVFVRERWF